MQILLTNDDGVYAPGILALERELQKLGNVCVVAPATEQSGVSQSITFLSPLFCKEVRDGDRQRGWAVEGTPADCVKLGMFELSPQRPDLIVSGINGGLNAGINVLYSGTVGAAIEGAFYGVTSIAVSLEYEERPPFTEAAKMARQLIEQILACRAKDEEQQRPTARLYNVNIPTSAVAQQAPVRVVPMGVAHYGAHYIKGKDPKGRTYYWATTDPPPEATAEETDLTALNKGQVTVSPLDFDMTRSNCLEPMDSWQLETK